MMRQPLAAGRQGTKAGVGVGLTGHEEVGRRDSRAPRRRDQPRLICLLLVALGWNIASVAHH